MKHVRCLLYPNSHSSTWNKCRLPRSIKLTGDTLQVRQADRKQEGSMGRQEGLNGQTGRLNGQTGRLNGQPTAIAGEPEAFCCCTVPAVLAKHHMV